jgi:hypothetical protein
MTETMRFRYGGGVGNGGRKRRASATGEVCSGAIFAPGVGTDRKRRASATLGCSGAIFAPRILWDRMTETNAFPLRLEV